MALAMICNMRGNALFPRSELASCDNFMHRWFDNFSIKKNTTWKYERGSWQGLKGSIAIIYGGAIKSHCWLPSMHLLSHRFCISDAVPQLP